MGMLKIAKDPGKKTDNYKNKKSTENLIRYVTRANDAYTEAKRAELKSWGVYGAVKALGVEHIIDTFEEVQQISRISTSRKLGPKMFHEEYVLDDDEIEFFSGKSDVVLADFASKCTRQYFDLGFQVVYAVHKPIVQSGKDDKSKIHIHIAGNAVNFKNGKKWHSNINEDQRAREAVMNAEYLKIKNKCISPIQFE